MLRTSATIISALALAAFVVTPAVSVARTPTAPRASAISTSYAKRAIRLHINRKYTVALGLYFGACQKLAANTVRCEVQFKAGLYWRCGRVSVRNSGSYDYITTRLPIGC